MKRLNINVSATDYKSTSDGIKVILNNLEKMVHMENSFSITDYEFTFGWYFYVVSINIETIEKLAEQEGNNYQKLNGKGQEKKFLTWITEKIKKRDNIRIKLSIKEEMESNKFGLF